MEIREYDRTVFFGDNITEQGRDKSNPDSLGRGYANIAATDLLDRSPELGLRFYDRGADGDKVQGLLNRVSDCSSCQPDTAISVIGVNDVWHLVGKDGLASQEKQQRFENVCRQLLQVLKQAGIKRTLLTEPFVLDYPEDRMERRRDLGPKVQIVYCLVCESELELAPLDGLMGEQALLYGRRKLAGDDGVYPALAGANITTQEVLRRLIFTH